MVTGTSSFFSLQDQEASRSRRASRTKKSSWERAQEGVPYYTALGLFSEIWLFLPKGLLFQEDFVINKLPYNSYIVFKIKLNTFINVLKVWKHRKAENNENEKSHSSTP